MILTAVVCALAIKSPEPVAVLLLFGIWLKLQDNATEARTFDRPEIERRVCVAFEARDVRRDLGRGDLARKWHDGVDMTDPVAAPLLTAGHLGLEVQMTIVTTLEEKALAALPELAPWVKVQARHEPEVDIVSLINPEAPEGYRMGSVAIAAGRSSGEAMTVMRSLVASYGYFTH